jgi:hypothetical protein
MGRPSKSKLVKTLQRLQREKDPVQRSHLIEPYSIGLRWVPEIYYQGLYP